MNNEFIVGFGIAYAFTAVLYFVMQRQIARLEARQVEMVMNVTKYVEEKENERTKKTSE